MGYFRGLIAIFSLTRYVFRGSVRPSVRPSVGGSVRNAFFFSIPKMKVFLHVCHQEGPGTSQKCKIASLQVGMSVGPSILE